MTRLYKPDEGVVTLAVRLPPSKEREVTLVRPDGSPAAHADAALLVSDALANQGPGVPGPSEVPESRRTTAEGRLRLRTDPGFQRLVVSHADGHLDADVTALESGAVLTLRPWARLEGTAWRDGKPAPGREFELTYLDLDLPGTSWGPTELRAVADAEGRFAFERVPPAHVALVELRPVPGDAQRRSWTQQHVLSVVPSPGETVRVDVGKTDRRVVVRPRPADGTPGGIRYAILGTFAPQLPPEARADPAALRNWMRRPEIVRAQRTQRVFPLTRDPDGSWRGDGVRPGTYQLRVVLEDPSGNSSENRPPGSPPRILETSVVVKEGPTETVEDLGEIVLPADQP